MGTYRYTDTIIKRVFDGDFDTVMKSIGFNETPRDFFTINDMVAYGVRQENELFKRSLHGTA